MDPFSLTWVIEQIGSWFDRLARRRDHLRDEERAAVQLYVAALTMTKNYIGRVVENPKARKRAREERLAQAWGDAAAAVQALDHRLARACLDKSEYWSLPAEWREHMDQSRLAVIAIDRMTARANELLANTGGPRPRKARKQLPAT